MRSRTGALLRADPGLFFKPFQLHVQLPDLGVQSRWIMLGTDRLPLQAGDEVCAQDLADDCRLSIESVYWALASLEQDGIAFISMRCSVGRKGSSRRARLWSLLPTPTLVRERHVAQLEASLQ